MEMGPRGSGMISDDLRIGGDCQFWISALPKRKVPGINWSFDIGVCGWCSDRQACAGHHVCEGPPRPQAAREEGWRREDRHEARRGHRHDLAHQSRDGCGERIAATCADHERKPDTGGEIIGRSLDFRLTDYGNSTLIVANGPKNPRSSDLCVSRPPSIAPKKKSAR